MLFQTFPSKSTFLVTLKMLFTTTASVISLISMAAGHGAVTSYIIGGATYPGFVLPPYPCHTLNNHQIPRLQPSPVAPNNRMAVAIL